MAARARNRHLPSAALAGLATLIVVIALAACGQPATGGGSSASTPKGAAAVRAEFAGIPQDGTTLGSPRAPAAMMVFADLQCPFCAHFENDALPALIKRYVRTGKLKLVFQPIAVIGPDSTGGASAAAAASLQNRLWQYAALFYRNQGAENTGYVTEKFLNRIARATPGLDVTRFTRELRAEQAGAIVSRAQASANTAAVHATPTFMVKGRGGVFERFQPSALEPQAFYGRLDALTR